VGEQSVGVLLIDWRGGIVGGAVLDLVPGEVDGDVRLPPTDGLDPLRGEDDLPTREPFAGVHEKIRKFPRDVVEEEILHLTDGAVAGSDFVTAHLAGAAEMRVVLLARFRDGRARLDGWRNLDIAGEYRRRRGGGGGRHWHDRRAGIRRDGPVIGPPKVIVERLLVLT
jgi:hypothetical protein